MRTWRILAAAVAIVGVAGTAQQSMAAAGVKAKGGGGTQADTGNPCKPSGTTKGCRDWILGNPKPPISKKN